MVLYVDGITKHKETLGKDCQCQNSSDVCTCNLLYIKHRAAHI